METNKVSEQNKYLLSKVGETEKQLKSLLLNFDKTEFAEENAKWVLSF